MSPLPQRPRALATGGACGVYPSTMPTRLPALALRTAALVLGAILAGAACAGAVTVDGIAAVVNGEVVTLLELEKAGRAALEERLRDVPAAQRETVRRETLRAVLDQLVMKRLQAQRARQLGVWVSDQEVETAIGSIMAENRIDQEALERLLAERRISREEYRREIEDQIRLSKLVQQEVRSRVIVTEEEVEAWYGAHREEWSRPERIRIRHLLVPLAEGASEDQVEAARREALRVVERHRAGEEFAALVRERSPGSARGPDAVSGEIARGELFPALEEAAFSLPVGGVGDPVRSGAGFHVVQVAERFPAQVLSLEEVRPSIETRIAESRTRERFEAWLRGLREDALIEIRF